jgi:serine protease Do
VSPGSSAEKVGLRGVRIIEATNEIVPGDVILAVDGARVASVGELLARLDDKRVGENARLGVWRDGKTLELTVILQSSGEPSTL